MKRSVFYLSSLVCLMMFFGVFAEAQTASNEVLIGIYQISAGKHLDFLKWQAKQEAVRKEAGVGATQWYVHANGASWDYLGISPVLTSDQQAKIDELSKQKGMATGFKAGLEFRTFIGNHSDTFAFGPFSISDLLKEAE